MALSWEEIKAAHLAKLAELGEPESPTPETFGAEPRQPVGDVAFGTGEVPGKAARLPPEVAAGAPAPEAAGTAAGVGAGIVGAQVVETAWEALKGPAGSIAQLAGPSVAGGGGGGDRGAEATSRAVLAALNKAGNVGSYFGS